jgi:hypothetical protein
MLICVTVFRPTPIADELKPQAHHNCATLTISLAQFIGQSRKLKSDPLVPGWNFDAAQHEKWAANEEVSWRPPPIQS